METAAPVIGVSATRAVTTSVIKESIDKIQKKYGQHKAFKKISPDNEELIASLSKLMLVKTLFTGTEKPENLFNFFQNPKLEYKSEVYSINSIAEICQHSTIPNCQNFIIKGTVGQGKSIFMRYLSINDLIHNARIPIFIELKNISKTKNLNYLIKEFLSPWIEVNDQLLTSLLKSGKISLFLDAYDEVDSDLLQDAFSDINHVCQSYKDLVVVVSSRPDTIILNSSVFEIINLKPYGYEEQEGLIKKLITHEDDRKYIINSINNSTHEVKDVLTTPLMVVLFIQRYKVGFSVPKHVSEFYQNIFDVVTFTHDRSKGIEKRKSYSSLQGDLENIFARFCFETFLREKMVFDKSTFIELLKISVEKNSITGFSDFNNLIFDYTKFACLIIQDGTEYTFIHKSIQEFYTAKYISKLPEVSAKRIFNDKFLYHVSLDNYLNFIKILNPYYYNKFYVLNSFENYKSVLNLEYLNNDDNFKKFIKSLSVFEERTLKKDNGIVLFNTPTIFFNLTSRIYMDISRCLLKKGILKTNGLIGVNNIESISHSYKITQLMEIIDLQSITRFEEIRLAWNEICNIYSQHSIAVQHEETLDLDY